MARYFLFVPLIQYDLWQFLSVCWDEMRLNHCTKRLRALGLSVHRSSSSVLFFWPSHLPIGPHQSVYFVPVEQRHQLNHLWRWQWGLTATNWSKKIFSQSPFPPQPHISMLVLICPISSAAVALSAAVRRRALLVYNAQRIGVSWFHQATLPSTSFVFLLSVLMHRQQHVTCMQVTRAPVKLVTVYMCYDLI